MRVLLVKMSSMGDVIHTLPAVTDAQRACPGIQFDWIVEPAFAEIPSWHSAVAHVLPIPLRQWRRQLWKPSIRRAQAHFFESVAQTGPYDLILDAQGLYKSVYVAKKAQKALQKQGVENLLKKSEGPPLVGFDFRSAREPLAALRYDRRISVSTEQHAIARLRQLFAQALDYPVPDLQQVDYGVSPPQLDLPLPVKAPYWVFLHGTTWETKLWPEAYWRELIDHAARHGRQVVLPWGNDEERARSLRLAQGFDNVLVPGECLSLGVIASLLGGAEQVVAVDTGLAHLAAALNIPTLVIYRVTSPRKVGVKGGQTVCLASETCESYEKNIHRLSVEKSLRGIEPHRVIGELR